VQILCFVDCASRYN